MSKQLNSFQVRYGNENVAIPPLNPNLLISRLLKRSSCRAFLPTPLPEGTLELLIAAAQSASTSGLLQTWSVISLNAEDKKKLTANAQNSAIIGSDRGGNGQNYRMIDSSALFLIWVADLHRLEIATRSSLDPDIVNQINRAEYHLKAVVDASIAAQTFFMAAESMGIDGCYCGAIRQLPIEFLQREFNLPKYTFPLFATAHGFPDLNAKEDPRMARMVKPRLDQSMVLHHSKFKPAERLDEFDEYSEALKVLLNDHNSHKYTSFETMVNERLKPSPSKAWMGNALRKMGFNFN